VNNPVRFEPVLVLAGGLPAVTAAAVAVIFTFVHMTDAQQAAITGFVGVFVPLVAALIARGRTASVAGLDALAEVLPPEPAKAAAKKRR
jgi:hypothetical protein